MDDLRILYIFALQKRSNSATKFAAGDFFRKIVILDGNAKAWTDEEGIMYIGIIPFLLEENSLNL